MLALSQETQVIDVFNGDADGLCALHQFRLNHPAKATLISGVKRDVQLLDRLTSCSHTAIQVFDISLDSNIQALRTLLENQNQLKYFDHHAADQRFEHPRLELHWDSDSQICSSLLVYQYTQAKYPDWALVGSYGDGLDAVADKLAAQHQINCELRKVCCELGRLLNYNAYGDTLTDLIYSPIAVAEQLRGFQTVTEFLNETSLLHHLREAWHADSQAAGDLHPVWQSPQARIYVLPDQAWARRISGNFANQIKYQLPDTNVAILSHKESGFQVSIRSAKPDSKPAVNFAKTFETGGGRAGAAGINLLPATEFDYFSKRFIEYFCQV